MKLVSYANNGEPLRAGVLVGEHVIAAHQCAQRAELDVGVNWGSVRSLLSADPDDLSALERAAGELADRAGTRLTEVRLGPPVPDPEKILCIGVNYLDHVAEAQEETPGLGMQPDPVVFSIFNTALIGDGENIVLPSAAPEMVDWEGELAVVIGKHCRRVSKADALDYVAGYMVFNDVSARDLQMASPQWLIGKSFDTSAPCGPALVTRNEIPDPQALGLETRVNGEVMQSTTTSLMIHSVDRLIEFISSVITLTPGDIIATGTPAGVGYAREPKLFLKDGDSVTVTITGLGELTNRVIAEAGSA